MSCDVQVGDRVHTGYGWGRVTKLFPAGPTCRPTAEVEYEPGDRYAGQRWVGYRWLLSKTPWRKP